MKCKMYQYLSIWRWMLNEYVKRRIIISSNEFIILIEVIEE